jgi:hypothetical protein
MSIEADIHATLTGAPGLVARVGDRIFPSAIEQGSELPAVAFARTETEFLNTLSSETAARRARIAVQAWGPGQLDIEQIGDEIETAFAVLGVPPDSRFVIFDDELGLYGLTVEFDWWVT